MEQSPSYIPCPKRSESISILKQRAPCAGKIPCEPKSKFKPQQQSHRATLQVGRRATNEQRSTKLCTSWYFQGEPFLLYLFE